MPEPIQELTYTCYHDTCERYDIRLTNGLGWAIFTIDERGGLLSCCSDHGNFNHTWPCHGLPSFKHFLVEIARDPDYLLGKVSERSWFDEQRTVQELRREILRRLRQMDCTKDEARAAWGLVKTHADDGPDPLGRALYFEDWAANVFYEPLDLIIRDFPPPHRYWAERVYPLFAAEIKKELDSQPTPEADKVIFESPVHDLFGLTYASYYVAPRLVLESMPLAWQRRFVDLIHELNDELPDWENCDNYLVRARVGNKFIHDPLADYRRGARLVPKSERQEEHRG